MSFTKGSFIKGNRIKGLDTQGLGPLPSQTCWLRVLCGTKTPGDQNGPHELREGTGNPLQYSCLGSPMDRGGWWATVRPWGGRVGHD